MSKPANRYWAILVSRNSLLHGQTISIPVGSKLDGLKFSKIERMKPRARFHEREWYDNVLKVCLV